MTIKVNAAAKINLYLHVTGKRDDGYHLLDTLVAFSDYGDVIDLDVSDSLHLDVTGPFAAALADLPPEDNLVIKAVRLLADTVGYDPDFRITLTKNLPPASGIGGGSADAAAALKACMQYWGISQDAAFMPDILTKLGADVPMCFDGRPARIRGIGEIISPLDTPLPPLHAVLVNPGVVLSTPLIFKNYSEPFHEAANELPNWDDYESVIAFLKKQDNTLTTYAMDEKPIIDRVLKSLDEQIGCRLARMSGSGATCFGLFDDKDYAEIAAANIIDLRPDWWVRTVKLG